MGVGFRGLTVENGCCLSNCKQRMPGVRITCGKLFVLHRWLS
jgi:hypothetical protein